MDDDIAIVQENPVGAVVALHLLRNEACLMQLLLYVVHHGLYLVLIGTAGNQKIIGQNGNFRNINDTDIARFLVFHGLISQTRHFFRLLLCHGLPPHALPYNIHKL